MLLADESGITQDLEVKVDLGVVFDLEFPDQFHETISLFLMEQKEDPAAYDIGDPVEHGVKVNVIFFILLKA